MQASPEAIDINKSTCIQMDMEAVTYWMLQHILQVICMDVRMIAYFGKSINTSHVHG